MTRGLGASLEVVRDVVTVTGLSGGCVMLALGWYSDRVGRKFGVVAPTLVAFLAYGAFYLWGGAPYAGSIAGWPIFWCYLLWTFGQSSAGMYGSWLSELFVVELRASAVATVYNVGRGAGALSPILVPLIAQALGGNLLHAMLFGVIGSVVCLIAVAALPETAGRPFAVIERKERAA